MIRSPLSLRGKIVLLLCAVLVVNIAGAGVTLWYANRTQRLYTNMLDRDMAALTAAQGLQNALTHQRGFVTYFFLSGDAAWLKQLEEHHDAFERWLISARNTSTAEESRAVLNEIESSYLKFSFSRKQVIDLYKQGRSEDGAKLHWAVREQYDHILDQCDRYKALHDRSIRESRHNWKTQARWLTSLAAAAMPCSLLLVLVLASVLFRQILNPIRQLAHDTEEDNLPLDEVEALSSKVRALLSDMDSARNKLDQTREQILMSEKLALVGKLAAGVAHSIRNPLTSVKMRLFSLERALSLDTTQKEDFEVVSEEITHIDTIVRNFLEFSRRPKLKTEPRSPSEVVDMSLQLIRHKQESKGITVDHRRNAMLPLVALDAEQLKEALVNVLLNAMEIMPEDGEITITEEAGFMEPLGRVAVIRIADNGPGIPAQVLERIFEPFFSTKEEGSGLGLAISKRIAEEHGGWLHAHSEEGKGATFVFALPCGEREWHRS